jgi:hypothetical protein
MPMNNDLQEKELICNLEASAKQIKHLISATPELRLRWKPSPEKWSMLEVLGHLVAEEQDDFRVRLKLLLQDPELDWPANNPEQSIVVMNPNSCDTTELLEEFSREREDSVLWLSNLRQTDWNIRKVHPIFGSMRAGDLLYSWVVHDLLHFKQLIELSTKSLSLLASHFSADYAG